MRIFSLKNSCHFIEKTYRIKGDKRYRAIAGLSMGGEGTFIYALHHPELFSSACPLSAATGPRSIEELKNYKLWQGVEGISDADKDAYFKKYSVLSLIENIPDDQKKAVRWYIDCGDDDFLYEGNSLVHIAMRKKEIPHEFRIRDGGHTWTYWRTALPTVLEFVSMSISSVLKEIDPSCRWDFQIYSLPLGKREGLGNVKWMSLIRLFSLSSMSSEP